jgi:hypothetical protein
MSPIAAIYNKHQYRNEQLSVLTAWAARVDELASGQPREGNVVALRPA